MTGPFFFCYFPFLAFPLLLFSFLSLPSSLQPSLFKTLFSTLDRSCFSYLKVLLPGLLSLLFTCQPGTSSEPHALIQPFLMPTGLTASPPPLSAHSSPTSSQLYEFKHLNHSRLTWHHLNIYCAYTMYKACLVLCLENSYSCFKALPDIVSFCLDPLSHSWAGSSLLHIISVVKVHGSDAGGALSALPSYPSVLCRLLHHECWGASTSRPREQPSSSKNGIWGLHTPASLRLRGATLRHAPPRLPGFCFGWSPSCPQQSPARGHSLPWFPLLPLLYFLTGASWPHLPNELLVAKSCPMICF